jgi:hypothetical protein
MSLWEKLLLLGFSIGLGLAVGVTAIMGRYLWRESRLRPENKSGITPTFLLPTATEVFHLRSECATLGEKILEDNPVGSALSQSQVSHYDPQTNRCYVELTVQTADIHTPVSDYLGRRYLYDGQTRELLAFAEIIGTPSEGKKSGMVFAGTGERIDNGYEAACLFIDKMMADDRKRSGQSQ